MKTTVAPRHCPNCGSNTIRVYPARFGKERKPVMVVRCTACNTGAVRMVSR